MTEGSCGKKLLQLFSFSFLFIKKILKCKDQSFSFNLVDNSRRRRARLYMPHSKCPDVVETGRSWRGETAWSFWNYALVHWHAKINWHSGIDVQASFTEEVFVVFNQHDPERSNGSCRCCPSSFGPLPCHILLTSSGMQFPHSEPCSVSDDGLLRSAILISWICTETFLLTPSAKC